MDLNINFRLLRLTSEHESLFDTQNMDFGRQAVSISWKLRTGLWGVSFSFFRPLDRPKDPLTIHSFQRLKYHIFAYCDYLVNVCILLILRIWLFSAKHSQFHQSWGQENREWVSPFTPFESSLISFNNSFCGNKRLCGGLNTNFPLLRLSRKHVRLFDTHNLDFCRHAVSISLKLVKDRIMGAFSLFLTLFRPKYPLTIHSAVLNDFLGAKMPMFAYCDWLENMCVFFILRIWILVAKQYQFYENYGHHYHWCVPKILQQFIFWQFFDTWFEFGFWQPNNSTILWKWRPVLMRGGLSSLSALWIVHKIL